MTTNTRQACELFQKYDLKGTAFYVENSKGISWAFEHALGTDYSTDVNATPEDALTSLSDALRRNCGVLESQDRIPTNLLFTPTAVCVNFGADQRAFDYFIKRYSGARRKL